MKLPHHSENTQHHQTHLKFFLFFFFEMSFLTTTNNPPVVFFFFLSSFSRSLQFSLKGQAILECGKAIGMMEIPQDDKMMMLPRMK